MPFDSIPTRIFKKESIHRDRLLGLCRVLETISDDAFDLRDWARNGSCDSVACAVGWAMRDGWFVDQGLSRADRSPAYGGLTGWKAVRDFFGLSKDEAFYLFHAGKYQDPNRRAVMTRIRALAETRS
jgi:hypothetical protein